MSERFTAGQWRVLPHEWAFGGFLALTAVRLAMSVGFSDWHTLAFFAFTFGCVVAVIASGRAPGPIAWRIRLLWYPSVMGLSFYTLATAVPLLGVSSADALLAQLDHSLLGFTPAVALTTVHLPWFTDLMVAAYLFFFYILIVGPGWYCVNDLTRFRACIVGLFTTYAFGFMGYTLLPAGGPHLSMTDLPPLDGGWLTQAMLPMVNQGSNGVDVFPSIHCAASLYLLIFDFRHYRRRFWWLLLPCIALWVSTVYLRYHYVVDLLGGVVIAAIGVATAYLYERSRMAREIEMQEQSA
ncbi:MAG: phosphatase PAP2 family protein [Pseudomonadota bacterium]